MNINIQGRSFTIPDGLSEAQIENVVNEIALNEGLKERQSAIGFSVDQAQKMAGQGIDVVGRMTGSEFLQNVGQNIVDKQNRQMAEGGYESIYKGSLTDAYKDGGLSNVAGWLGEKSQENLASAGYAIVGTGGAMIATAFSVPLGIAIGAGTVIGSFLLGAGETALEMEDKTGDYNEWLAGGGGALIAVLDRFGAGKVVKPFDLYKMSGEDLIKKLAKEGKPDAGRAVGKFLGKTVKSAGIETGTEATQQAVTMSATALEGGEYTGQEIANSIIDAGALGGTLGGGTSVGIDTASAVGKGIKKGTKAVTGKFEGYKAEDQQAGAMLAERLNKLAIDNNFDLQDIDKTSTKGARETADQVHVDIAVEMKQLIQDLKDRLVIDKEGIDTIVKVAEKVQASAGYRKARNKTKNIVGKADLDAVEKLTGDTFEGQQLLSLMRQSNELTKLHNSGYQGGVSKYTDLLSPFGSPTGYDKGAIATERILRPLATGGLALQTGGATLPIQVGASLAGRAIDKVTGQRSVLDQYVKANLGQEGITPTSDYSLREQAIQEEEQRKQDELDQQLKTEQGRQALEISRINSLNSNVNPQFGIYEKLNQMGLLPSEWRKGLDILLKEGSITQAQYDTMLSDPLSLRQEDQGYLVILNELNRLAQLNQIRAVNPTNPVTPSNEQTTSQPQQQQITQQQTTPVDPLALAKREAGIESNRLEREAIRQGINEAQNVSPTDKAIMNTVLDELGLNLGEFPVETAEGIRGKYLTKLQDKNVMTAIDPYINRIKRQQRQSTDEYRSLRNPDDKPPKRKLREIAEILEKEQFERYGRPLDPINNQEDFDEIVKTLTEDAQSELDNDPSVYNWYDEDVAQAIETAKKSLPELTENPNNEKLLLLLTALTSIGEKPKLNFRQGGVLALHYFETKNTKNRPVIGTEVEIYNKKAKKNEKRIVNPATDKILGFKGKSKETGLFILQHMLDTMGLDATFDWLHSEKTKKEIDDMRASAGFGKQAKILGGMNEVVPAVYMFGQKVAPFYLNLIGVNDVTVDLWASRNIRRLTGKLRNPLYDDSKARVLDKRSGKYVNKNKASELIDSPTASELPTFKRIFEEVGKNLKDVNGNSLSPQSAQAVLWKFEQELYNDLGGDFKHEKFSEGAVAFTEKEFKTYEQRYGFTRQRDAPTPNDATSEINEEKGIEPILTIPNVRDTGSDERYFRKQVEDLAKGKNPEKLFEIIQGMDMDGREFSTRVVNGLNGKGISNEDLIGLLPLLKLSFKYLTDNSSRGRYTTSSNGDNVISVNPNVENRSSKERTFRDVFLHEFAHHLEANTNVRNFIDVLTSIEFNVKENTMLSSLSSSKAQRQLVNEIVAVSVANRKQDFQNLFNQADAFEQLANSKGFSLGLKFQNIGDAPILQKPSVEDIINARRRFSIGLPKKVQNDFRGFLERIDYYYSAPELGAEAIANYLKNPKLFKKQYPNLAKTLRDVLNQSEFKNYLIFNTLAGLITGGTLMALLSPSDDDERGVFNFGSGMLSA
tara:strand:+ start:1052 stop:5602 length:4551 start_codon:yes stop_codon:yes gene_type:complete